MRAALQLGEPEAGLWKSRGERRKRRGASPWSERCPRDKTFVNDTKTVNLATGSIELLGTDLTLESVCFLLHIVKHRSYGSSKGKEETHLAGRQKGSLSAS